MLAVFILMGFVSNEAWDMELCQVDQPLPEVRETLLQGVSLGPSPSMRLPR